MDSARVAERLAKFGFSNYEARAYVSLLEHHPATGYEVAKRSHIPPSKIYEVLGKLLKRSAVSPMAGKPTRYVPQDRAVFLKSLRTRYDNALTYLESHLPAPSEGEFDYVWNVEERTVFLAKARELLEQAKKEIILLAWDEEIGEILKTLRRKRRLKIAVMRFGTIEVDVGVVYDHGIEKVLAREKEGRLFTLVVDSASLLQGIVSESGQVRGVYTTHPSLVELGNDYLRHEIYTTKMYDQFAERMDKVFGGRDLVKLRNIWENL